ncbi:putative ADP-heptose synthase [Desulforapulum autotrophicum HRM2]|uniref:D-glycero-beta-D-manno-heptose 1-phosphate adenylyltransferase n=2 Tax=Desulforapulum autotrophicum TaxID=2296 RepID=C0QB92_DESAH|nr:putative ADP-heptose synthase [Desulforapulum autotrophicum HRM2]
MDHSPMENKLTNKIVLRSEIKAIAEAERDRNKTIVFTNGCFDILHAGHVNYLEAAAAQGDILILGLNSDNSVRKIKGDKRPIINERQRAQVIAALACVDYVVLFDEPDPEDLIRMVVPHVLAKGADWSEDKIIGGDFVKANNGRVVRITLEPEISTTLIIERILKTFG